MQPTRTVILCFLRLSQGRHRNIYNWNMGGSNCKGQLTHSGFLPDNIDVCIFTQTRHLLIARNKSMSSSAKDAAVAASNDRIKRGDHFYTSEYITQIPSDGSENKFVQLFFRSIVHAFRVAPYFWLSPYRWRIEGRKFLAANHAFEE